MMSIEHVLFTWVDLCDRLNIDFAVMGGIAVRAHGVPRPTYDVDLTIAADDSKIQELLVTARNMDCLVPEPYLKGWKDRVSGMPVIKLKQWLKDGCGIDVDLFVAESPFLRSLMGRRQLSDVGGRQVPVATAEDVILLKLIASRPRDLGDVQDILFMQGGLDVGYMRDWAVSLEIVDRVDRALQQE